MKASTIGWALVIAIVVIGGWYWWSATNAAQPASSATVSGTANTPSQAGTATSQTPTGDGTGVSQNLALGTDSNAKLGTYLIAYNGMTLYTYGKDTLNKSNCTGQCAAAWPPYSVAAGTQLNLQAGVGGKIGTIQRVDGTTQITYNGRPLYFYAGDKASGDTTGEGIGGVWYVVKP